MIPPLLSARKEHSYLYHLEPIGIGTSGVESLTSYLARLAPAHWIPVQPLLIKILAPELWFQKLIAHSRDFSRNAFAPSTDWDNMPRIFEPQGKD